MTTLNSHLQLAMLNRKKAKKNAEKGFTLIELLITVVILGVLSAVAVPGFLAQKNKADIAAANAQGKALMTACKTAALDGTAVPSSVAKDRPFGDVAWDMTVTQTGTATPTECSSVTTGTGARIQQQYKLDMATGQITNTAGDGPAVDAE